MGNEIGCCNGSTDEQLAQEMAKFRERQGSLHPSFGMAPIPIKGGRNRLDETGDSLVDDSFFYKQMRSSKEKLDALKKLESQC